MALGPPASRRLALINDDQLEIGMRVCQDGQYGVHHQATATLVQTNADISGASSCLNCPPTDVANYCSTAAGYVCAVPPGKTGPANTHALP
jgi:hypothetical protein